MRGRHLLTKSVLLLTLVALTIAAIEQIPTPASSFYRAIVLKEDRLHRLPPGKVVIVGGSNVAFGIDSAIIEHRLGRPVVNMGLNAALGLPFMLDEVQPYLQPDDVIVISPEYSVFFVDDDITLPMCEAVMELPQPWRRIGVSRYVRCVATGIGRTLQFKSEWAVRRAIGRPMLPASPVYTLETFNDRGDVVGHLSAGQARVRRWLHLESVDTSNPPRDETIERLREFVLVAANRGARVFFAYPSYAQTSYGKTSRAVTSLDALLRRRLSPGLTFLSTPEDYVFPDEAFFDTEYHLAAPARAARSERLAQSLAAVLGPRHPIQSPADGRSN